MSAHAEAATASAPRILISSEIEAGALTQFKAWAEVDVCSLPLPDLLLQLPQYDAAVTMLSHRLGVAEFKHLAGSRLKILANHAVGYENIDLAAAASAGIWVSNTPDVLTQATAEMAWTLMLALARRLIEGETLVRSGQWQGWQPTQLLGQSVFGQTLGIVGAGRIGQAMAAMGKGFDVKVLYHSRQPKPEFEAQGAQWRPLPELFAEAGLISLHLPGGAASHHLIDAKMLARAQPGTLLVNTGRGSTLDEAALIQALQHGPLGGAALDVYEFEPVVCKALRSLPNVVLAPHLGSATVATRRAMALKCLQNIQAALTGQTPPNALNQPA